MSPTIRASVRRDDGYTLIELLVVVTIIGVLVALGLAAYTGYRERAGNTAAQANLRAALPSAEVYYGDNETYAGMTTAALRAVDPALSPSLQVVASGPDWYCLAESVAGRWWSVQGPGIAARGYLANSTCA